MSLEYTVALNRANSHLSNEETSVKTEVATEKSFSLTGNLYSRDKIGSVF